MDEDLKRQAETLLDNMGLNMTTAITVYLKTIVHRGKIPFEVAADPFYREENMLHLRRVITDADAGVNMTVHEMIEVDGVD
jgi:DNA-damage-inducible protein J